MKYAKFFGGLCLVCFLLSGCDAAGLHTAESTGAIEVPSGGWTLGAFEVCLNEQSEQTIEQFQQNYEIAQALLAAGTLPEGEMQTFLPGNPDPNAERIDPSTGFYRIVLDPDVFGVSQFFIVPEGQRKMTADEYLQLAQAADLPGEELVKSENIWMPLQNRTSSSSRPLTGKEQFWLMFQANEEIHNVGGGMIQPDVPILVYTGCGQTPGALGSFTIYPVEEMSDYAIRSAGFNYCRSLPEEERKELIPSAGEIDWKTALAEAKQAAAEQADQSGVTRKAYTRFENGIWIAALCYEDDSSYLVELNAEDGALLTLRKMPDGFCDYDFPWENQTAPEGIPLFP